MLFLALAKQKVSKEEQIPGQVPDVLDTRMSDPNQYMSVDYSQANPNVNQWKSLAVAEEKKPC